MTAAAVSTRRKPEPDPALRAAVEGHWDRSGQHPVWRGADFVRPTKVEPEGEPT